jgi:hypothetical protein
MHIGGIGNFEPRGLAPPGDVLLSGDKSTQKRLLLAEGMSDSCARRHCQADTGAAQPTFCGAHPLGAPRQSARRTILPNAEHSAFGTWLPLVGNIHPFVTAVTFASDPNGHKPSSTRPAFVIK